MNDPQIWTLIAVFSALMVGFATVVIAMIGAQSRSIGGQSRSIDGLQAAVGAINETLTQVRIDLVKLDAKFDAKFDQLDRDVQAIAVKVFPERDA